MILPYFQSPHWLLLLFLLPPLVWLQLRWNRRRKASIRFPSLKIAARIPPSKMQRARHLLLTLRLAVLALFIIGLARPQRGEDLEEVSTQGVDIMLALDISSTMKTMDFKPHNRLYVAKQVIENFIAGRKSDRLGLVVFARKSFTQCPLTLDYGILTQFLRQVEIGLIEDGTAIGTGLLTATNRLRETKAKSKVIILATDGMNNAGEVDPVTAARAAKALGVKIYTIGVGENGEQPMEIDDPVFGRRIVSVPTQIDEETLRQVASLTGGQYFRARNAKMLEEIYGKIDAMEKTEIETSSFTRYQELFAPLVMAALALLALEVLLANTRFMKIP